MLFSWTQLLHCRGARQRYECSAELCPAGICVTQSKKQMLNTDFTHVNGLSLWTRQLHQGRALTIDLTGAGSFCHETHLVDEAVTAGVGSYALRC